MGRVGGSCGLLFPFPTFFSASAPADCETDGYLSSSGFVDLPDVPSSLSSPVAAPEPSFTSVSPQALSGAGCHVRRQPGAGAGGGGEGCGTGPSTLLFVFVPTDHSGEPAPHLHQRLLFPPGQVKKGGAAGELQWGLLLG